MRPLPLIITFCTLLIFACGDQTAIQFSDTVPSGAPPLVLRVSPASGALGTEVSIFGIGYSVIPQENIVHLGEAATPAESYTPISNGEAGEAEQLTFSVPDNAVPGDHIIFISVLGIPSNAEMIFTVIP